MRLGRYSLWRENIRLPMNDLLELAVEAHGGLKRWSQLTTVKASLSITGKLWQLKAQPEALKDVVVEAQLKREQLTTHLIGKNRRTVFTPDRVSIESESGILEEGRDDPRSAFQGQRLETPWDCGDTNIPLTCSGMLQGSTTPLTTAM